MEFCSFSTAAFVNQLLTLQTIFLFALLARELRELRPRLIIYNNLIIFYDGKLFFRNLSLDYLGMGRLPLKRVLLGQIKVIEKHFERCHEKIDI